MYEILTKQSYYHHRSEYEILYYTRFVNLNTEFIMVTKTPYQVW